LRPRTHASDHAGGLQSTSVRRDTYGVPHAAKGRDFLLKRAHVPTEDELLGVADAVQRPSHLRPDRSVLRAEIPQKDRFIPSTPALSSCRPPISWA
jgi:hypothetical protein